MNVAVPEPRAEACAIPAREASESGTAPFADSVPPTKRRPQRTRRGSKEVEQEGCPSAVHRGETRSLRESPVQLPRVRSQWPRTQADPAHKRNSWILLSR